MKRIVSLYGLFVLVFGTLELHAQTWENVNDPYATRQVYQAAAFDAALWLLDDGDASVGTPSTSLRLRSFKSGIWTVYTTHTPSGIDSLHGISVAGQGDFIYVTAATWLGGIQKGILFRLEIPTQTWSEVSSVSNKLVAGSRINVISFFGNELYLAGELFNAQGENQVLRYKPAFDVTENVTRVVGEVKHLASFQNLLCFGGEFDSIGSKPIKNMAYYSSGNFSSYSGSGTPGLLKTLDNGDMVFFEENQPQQNSLSLWSNSGNDEVLNHNFPGNFLIRDLDHLFNQTYSIQTEKLEGLFAPGIFHLNSKIGKWERTKATLDPEQSVFVNTGTQIFLVELSGNAVHLQEMKMGRLSGRVFVDIDGDCAKTMGDRYLGQEVLVHDKLNEVFLPTTEATGSFDAFVNAGNFELEVPNLPARLSDKLCSWNDSFYLGSGDTVKVDIPLSVEDTTAAVRLELVAAAGFRARQGFDEKYELVIYNEGFRFQNCPVTISLPEYITFTGADIMPDDSNGAMYTWNVNIVPFQKQIIRFSARVDLTAPAYSKQRIDFWSDSTCLRYSNRDSLVLKVVGAYDPNDKQSSPEGNLKLETTEIIYTIRFQNTGTDTAINVYIIDTLDLNLPLMSFKMLPCDLSYRITIDGSAGVVRFDFDSIMLPDSSVDLEGSKGTIGFKAKLRPNMKEGDSLRNTAYIYFDYQKPIITNTVMNKMAAEPDHVIPVVGSGDKFLVYPNPASKELTIVNFTSEPTPCILYNLEGKVIARWNLNADAEAVFLLNGLKPGMYFIRFPEWNMQQPLVIDQRP